jgi:alpha-N-arabinofuranosidase
VISWLQTKKDGLLKQPSFYIFQLVSNNARGKALDVAVNAGNVETKQFGGVPALDVSASFDESTGNGAIFLVNRSLTDTVATDVIWQDRKDVQIEKAYQLAGTDPKEFNSWEEPNRLVANAITAPVVNDGSATIQLPPLSFTVLTTHAQ